MNYTFVYLKYQQWWLPLSSALPRPLSESPRSEPTPVDVLSEPSYLSG